MSADNPTPPAPGTPGYAAAKRDEASRLLAAVEQGTGRAIEVARLGAAFFLEAVRAGVPQGEAITLAGEYVRAELQNALTREFMRDRTDRGPLDR